MNYSRGKTKLGVFSLEDYIIDSQTYEEGINEYAAKSSEKFIRELC